VPNLIHAQTTAAAGSVIGDATQITHPSPTIVHATGADATKGIKLPPATKGKMYFIKNADAANAVLKVYPYDTSDQINALTAGDPISMAAKTAAVFVSFDTTHWYSFSLLPS
jgi:hypothetical protein